MRHTFLSHDNGQYYLEVQELDVTSSFLIWLADNICFCCGWRGKALNDVDKFLPKIVGKKLAEKIGYTLYSASSNITDKAYNLQNKYGTSLVKIPVEDPCFVDRSLHGEDGSWCYSKVSPCKWHGDKWEFGSVQEESLPKDVSAAEKVTMETTQQPTDFAQAKERISQLKAKYHEEEKHHYCLYCGLNYCDNCGSSYECYKCHIHFDCW